MTREQIIEAIKAMTVLELNELVKACEEEFGVSAAAPVGVAAVAGAARVLGHVCPPSLLQRVIAKCASLQPDLEAYDRNRRLIVDGLNRIKGFTCHCPKGAFYVFPCIKEFGMSSDEFATRLLQEEKLAIVLGTEGDGLAAGTIADCDYTVCIPMSHGVDSLNVAAASAVAFWQLGNR